MSQNEGHREVADLSNGRFAKRLVHDEASQCLLWTGSRNKKGYGQINVGGRPRFTHRLAWELEYGEIAGGLCVLHKCDTPACCNPAHLFLGTRAENNSDMTEKGRNRQGVKNSEKTECKRGHPLSGANLRISNGRRHCRSCLALWARNKRNNK